MNTEPTVQQTTQCSCGAPLGKVRVGRKMRDVEVPFVRAYVWNELTNEHELRRVNIAHHTTCPHVDVNLRDR